MNRRRNAMRSVGLYLYLGSVGVGGGRRVWDHSAQTSRRGTGREGKENPGFSLDRECVRRRRCSSLSRIISNLFSSIYSYVVLAPAIFASLRCSCRFSDANPSLLALLCTHTLSLSLCLSPLHCCPRREIRPLHNHQS